MMIILEKCLPFIFLLGLTVITYQIFLSDYINNKIKTYKDKNNNKDVATKIARVKLISDDPKDIEKFIITNAQYLSDDLVKKLVERIEIIKFDKIIIEDNLKTRIANNPKQPQLIIDKLIEDTVEELDSNKKILRR